MLGFRFCTVLATCQATGAESDGASVGCLGLRCRILEDSDRAMLKQYIENENGKYLNPVNSVYRVHKGSRELGG